jgi:hypothetical protein
METIAVITHIALRAGAVVLVRGAVAHVSGLDADQERPRGERTRARNWEQQREHDRPKDARHPVLAAATKHAGYRVPRSRSDVMDRPDPGVFVRVLPHRKIVLQCPVR